MQKIKKNYPKDGQLTINVAGNDRVYPMEITVSGRKYEFLGAGSYNIAYKSVDQPYEVYKQLFSKKEETDLPERAVDVWNKINPMLEAKLSEDGKGWIAPFVSGVDATSAEVSNALVDIYKDTGRIVVDAYVKGNFKKMSDGTIVCVDIGAALQLETRLERAAEQSKASLGFWDIRGMKAIYDEGFEKLPKSHLQTVNMTKALLYLKLHRPDEQNLEYLKTDPKLVEILAGAYTKNLNPEQIPRFDDIFISMEALMEKDPLLFKLRDLGFNNNELREINQNGLLQQQHKEALIFLIEEKKMEPVLAYAQLKTLTGDQAALIRELYDDGLRPANFSFINRKKIDFSEERKEALRFFVKAERPVEEVITLITARESQNLKELVIAYSESDEKELFWDAALAGKEPKESVDKLAESVETLIKKPALHEVLTTRQMVWDVVNQINYGNACASMRNQLIERYAKIKNPTPEQRDEQNWNLLLLERAERPDRHKQAINDAKNRYSVAVRDAVEHVLFNSPQSDENLARVKVLLLQESAKARAPEWMRDMAELFVPSKKTTATLDVVVSATTATERVSSASVVASEAPVVSPSAQRSEASLHEANLQFDDSNDWEDISSEGEEAKLIEQANKACAADFKLCKNEAQKEHLQIAKETELSAIEKYRTAQPDDLIKCQLEALKAKLEYRKTLYEISIENKQERAFGGHALPSIFHGSNEKTASQKLKATIEMLKQVNEALGPGQKPLNSNELKDPAANRFSAKGEPKDELTKLKAELIRIEEKQKMVLVPGFRE